MLILFTIYDLIFIFYHSFTSFHEFVTSREIHPKTYQFFPSLLARGECLLACYHLFHLKNIFVKKITAIFCLEDRGKEAFSIEKKMRQAATMTIPSIQLSLSVLQQPNTKVKGAIFCLAYRVNEVFPIEKIKASSQPPQERNRHKKFFAGQNCVSFFVSFVGHMYWRICFLERMVAIKKRACDQHVH